MSFKILQIFDYIFSLLIFFIAFPIILFTYLFLLLFQDNVIYKSERIGYNKKKIIIFKFRTMHSNQSTGVTIASDNRITKLGRILRKLKIDELPQLVNILKKEINLVGPRPENYLYLKNYTNYFDYLKIVKPGIIDIVTLLFVNESENLNSEEDYVEKIIPLKSTLHNKIYQSPSFLNFFLAIVLTFFAILNPKKVQKFILKYLKNSFYLSNQEEKILRNFLKLDIKTS